MLREFEKLFRRVLKRSGDVPLGQKSELLRQSHRADCMIADLGTALNMGGQNLDELTREMDRLMSDPEIRKVHGELFDAKCQELGRGLDGYESFALWAEAGRIIEKRDRRD